MSMTLGALSFDFDTRTSPLGKGGPRGVSSCGLDVLDTLNGERRERSGNREFKKGPPLNLPLAKGERHRLAHANLVETNL